MHFYLILKKSKRLNNWRATLHRELIEIGFFFRQKNHTISKILVPAFWKICRADFDENSRIDPDFNSSSI